MTSSKVWLITGANTGFGLELSLKALKEGDKVLAAVRTPSKIPDDLKRSEVVTLPFDLSWSQDKINAFAKDAFAAFGSIDVVVNNAAYPYLGPLEESTDENLKYQFDINFFGPLRVIRAVLPNLRAQGSGTIVNISSLGGFHSFPANGMYCSTKFALEGMTEALAAEIAPFGLKALIVEPGYFRTTFLASAAAGVNMTTPMKAYEGTIGHEAVDDFTKYNGKQLGNPVLGAARIWEVVSGKGMAEGLEMKLRLPLGSDTGSALRTYAKELTDTADHYETIWKSTDFAE